MCIHHVFFLSRIHARNLFLCGKPGTGKTVCVQYLLKEIRRHAEEKKTPLRVVYVNAGKTRTPYYTMLELVKRLGLEVADRGWQMYRLKQAFENATRDEALVIALDEVDAILFKEKEPLVYYLNRQPNTTLILLSNQIEDATTLPPRALSTLQPRLLKLLPYTAHEANTILTERAHHALQPNTLPAPLLDTIAQVTAKAEDLRLGFAILLTAARHADDHGKTQIDADDVKAAIESETRVTRLKDTMAHMQQLRARLKRRTQ